MKKKIRTGAAMLLLIAMLGAGVSATEDMTAESEAETVVSEQEASEEAKENRLLTVFLLVSSVSAAMVVTALIFRTKDHTKYL